jgi:methyl-accepting chemotaxis protein
MKWFLKRPLRDKFIVLFAPILLVVFVQSFLTVRAVRNDQEAFRLVLDSQKRIADGDDAFRALASMQSNYRGFLVSGDETFVDRLKGDESQYRSIVSRLTSSPDAAEAERWRVVDAAVRDWNDKTVTPGLALRRKVNEGTGDQSEVSAFLSTGAGQRQFDAIANGINEAQDVANAQTQDRATVAEASATNVVFVIVGSGMFVALLCLLTISSLRRRIADPLDNAASKARSIADGNVDVEPFDTELSFWSTTVPIEESQDEIANLKVAMNGTLSTLKTVDEQARAISEGRLSDDVLARPVPGELGDSLRQMTENLRQYAELSRALSDGDLSADVQPRSAEDELGTIARAMTENLRSMVGNVRTVTEQVNDGAKALADGAEESAQLASDVADAVSTITGGIAGQARATEDVSGAVAEIGSQVRSTVAAVSAAKQASDRAGELGTTGQRRVDEVVQAMDRIASSMADVSSSVVDLTAQARQVDGMVELIQTIADQTHMLALNASIEAARAGAAGRGFAVVASEVKALAEQAGEATDEIGAIVERMRAGADHAVTVLATEQADVTLGAGAVAAAGSAFDEIVDGISAIAGRIDQVEDAAHRIDDSARTIESRTSELVELATVNGAGIEEVAAASEQTAATAEEIGATAHELAASVETLREAMARIRAPETVAGEPTARRALVGAPGAPDADDGATKRGAGGGVLRRGGRHPKR